MSNFSGKMHLRLISNDNGSPRERLELGSSKVNNCQLSFAFSEEFRFIFIREADILRDASFMDLLAAVRPCYLFDIRLAPRLDFVASNRSLAFRAFGHYGINYVDIIGTLGVDSHLAGSSMPEFWCGLVGEKLKATCDSIRNSIFIFDNDEVLKRSQYVLPAYVKSSFSDASVEIVNNLNQGLIAM
jgi:hypothetical protein